MSVLQWARAHGCPYGMLTVQGAREAMLQEEIAPRYPDWDVTLDEIPEEFEAVLEWLRADGARVDACYRYARRVVAGNDVFCF